MIYKQLSGLQISHETVGEAVRELGIRLGSSEGELLSLVSKIREKDKPILLAANKIDLHEAKENFTRLKGKHRMIPCSSESELALREAAEHGMINYLPGSGGFTVSKDLSPQQRKALDFIQKNVLEIYGSTGVQQALNSAAFELLDMIAVYPVANIGKLSDKSGNVLPDSHLVKRGTRLRDFAYKIHKEIGEKFIGGLDVQKKKIGAEYELKDGDIVEILTGK